ncbi:Protein GufA [Diplonema papillatum]|nr:Protein GufA [Diplonema papillatum]|eukprot:gene15796-24129_t
MEIAAYLQGLTPLQQALLGTLFTWGVTALGASLVVLDPLLGSGKTKQQWLDACYGFSGGVMLAASYWSLLAPAISIAEKTPAYADYALAERIDGSFVNLVWLPVAIGFAVGAGFVVGGDELVSRYLKKQRDPMGKKYDDELPEAVLLASETSWRRVLLLVAAITLHNIPEGLAVGVGFGALGTQTCDVVGCSFGDAFNLALGIGLQNFPEGMAVALPLRRQGVSLWKCFFYGQLSGMVEPIAGVIGSLMVTQIEPILPYAMAFAAGAMVFVVVDDLIPEAQAHGNGRTASIGCMVGFLTMMTLDVALG